jgi:hypothetical protein
MRAFSNISRRIVAQVLIDAVLVAFANGASFLLRYDLNAETFASYLQTVLVTLPVLVVFRVSALYAFNLYRIHWRYMSIHDLRALAGATSVSSVAFFGFLWLAGLGTPTLLLGHAGDRLGCQRVPPVGRPDLLPAAVRPARPVLRTTARGNAP